MKAFLVWTLGIAFVIAAYLLWLRSRASRASGRSRFQIRLTSLFLVCVLLPSVPLLFSISTLLTQSVDVLLVPEIEKSLLSGLDALKQQLEQHAQLFDAACDHRTPSPALMQQWHIRRWSTWHYGSGEPRVVSGVPDMPLANGMSFPETWGTRQSRLRTEAEPAVSEVWLPRADSSMVLVEFPVAGTIVDAKNQLSRAVEVYDSLALIKEEVIRGGVIWAIAITAIVVLAAIASVIARALARQLSGPIEQLTTAMSRAAGGDLDFQAGIAAPDEIATLVSAFNTMIRDLRESRDRLVTSERLAAWREVARQASHEIKNPLTPIHLALHRLRTRYEKNDFDPAVIRDSFQSIEEELAALGRLAEEFSAFARLPEPRPEPTDLNELVQSAALVHGTGPSLLRIHTDLLPDLPHRPIDRDQMRRVLTNLLKNAAEAAAGARLPCEVTLRTRLKENRILLEVCDRGPGMSAEALRKIFQPNFTTKREGSGLGLVMVKRIIEQHGGTIEVESTEGKGTRFSILL